MKKKSINSKDIRKNARGFVVEFKDFILRGNVMDMAIGVIIGSSFSGIVTALTDDFINPLINGIGGAEVAGTFKIYGNQVIKYGDFITSVINFLIMAMVLFLMLKFVNKLTSITKSKAVESESKPSDEVLLLQEICDLLKNKSN